MKNKKIKSSESKLRIDKDVGGERTCVAVKPSKPSSSSNKTACIATKGGQTKTGQSVHTHTPDDSNANQSEHQQPHSDSHHDQSENPHPQNDPPSHADSHIAHSHPPTDDADVATDIEDMEQSSEKALPQLRTPTATGLAQSASRFNIRKVGPNFARVSSKYCKQSAALPDLNFDANPFYSDRAVRNYLRKCNCHTCIKKLFKVILRMLQSERIKLPKVEIQNNKITLAKLMLKVGKFKQKLKLN